MKIRIEDLPEAMRAKVLAELRLLPAKKKAATPVVVRAPIFCTLCGSYEHLNQACPSGICVGARAPWLQWRFAVPVRTTNEQNGAHGHWSGKAKKRDQVRAAIGRAWKTAAIAIRPRYRVTITRIASPLADELNLGAFLKSVIDEVASQMKVDDASKLIEWKLQQEPGPRETPAVRIEIEELP